MATAVLTISGRGKTWQVEPDANGTIIGRSPRCGVVIESKDVSREHARIFKDPFNRWIVEDLGSSNGVFINGKRTERCAVFHGEPIIIGSFSLMVMQSFDQLIKGDDSIKMAANISTEGFEAEIISGKNMQVVTLPHPRLEQLNEFTDRLSGLTSSSALYPEVCRSLAQGPKTVAAVLRLPEKTAALPEHPEILACHFGDGTEEAMAGDTASFPVPRLAFRLSGHVLEAVRKTGDAAMVKTVYSSDTDVTWTALDAQSPRAIICVPLGYVLRTLDLLYLDIPIDESSKTTPEEIFEFALAVCRQIILTRKSLILMQMKAQRSILDHELSLAEKIQSRLAPTIPQNLSGVDIAVCYKPVMWVGGDYCDVWSLKDGRLAFAVGDVSNTGLPAAIAMLDLRTALRTMTVFCNDPSEVIKRVNLHLIENLPERTIITLFFGLFDASKGSLEYSNAGHLQPLVVGPKGTVQLLGQPGASVIGNQDATFRTKLHNMNKDEQLIGFTDGVTKAKDPGRQEFGIERLAGQLKANEYRGAKTIIDLVANGVEQFRGTAAQMDDITVFVLGNHK